MSASPTTALLLGGALVALVAAPVLQHRRKHPVDDFPLSHYPMFSAKRRQHGHVVHLVIDDEKGTTPVPYHRIGTGGFNQVRRQIARRAKTLEGALKMARQVAQKLGAPQVRVVRSTFEYDRFFAGDHTPKRVRTLATAVSAA